MGKAKLFKKNNATSIKQKPDPEKRRKRLVLMFSLFMVGLMVFSILEVALYRNNTNSNNQMKYCDYEFVLQSRGGGSILTTNINDQEVEFVNLPTQVVDLNVSPVAIEELKAAQLIILTTDMNQSLSDLEIIDPARLQFGLAINKTMNAMLYEDERYKLPVVDCTRSSPQNVVVVFNTSNETSVVVDGSCITINAQKRDMISIKDRMIFEYYGILKNGVVNTECDSWFNKMFN